MEDLFSGTVIESDSACKRIIINPIVKACKIVRAFVVIATVIEFLKDNYTAGSSFLIGYHFIVENVLKKNFSWLRAINLKGDKYALLL